MTVPSEQHVVSTLRGPVAQPIGRRFWNVTGILLIAAIVVIVIISFTSAVNDIARINRLKFHGVPVAVTITNCAGNIGGSGSNAAGYTCRGVYAIKGDTYHEIIGSKTTLSAAGSKVRCVADPAQPSTIELASAVTSASPSPTTFVVPSLLALLLLALVGTLLRRRRLKPRSEISSPSVM
jgi:MYXO-CTERM domain-containing protein